MSKPSYAAVVAGSPTDAPPKQQGDAPPPYTVGGPSNQQPHQTHLPSQAQAPSQHHVESQQIYHPGEHDGWVPPPTLAVARSRALRRFWVAFVWAWAIWILIGLIIGGGINDIESNPIGRHGHWGKHGKWHDDAGTIHVDDISSGINVPGSFQ